MPQRKFKAHFIEPVLLMRTDTLPEGEDWAYEIKLDGYRCLAMKTNRRGELRSRNRYAPIAAALRGRGGRGTVRGFQLTTFCSFAGDPRSGLVHVLAGLAGLVGLHQVLCKCHAHRRFLVCLERVSATRATL